MKKNSDFSPLISPVTALSALLLFAAPGFTGEPAPPAIQLEKPANAQLPETKAATDPEQILPGEMITLDRSIAIALKKNPQIVAATSSVDASRSRVGEARSNYYPQVSAQGGYTRVSPLQSTPTGTFQRQRNYDQYGGSVTVSQNLIDFGKTSSQVNISKFNLDASRSDLNTISDQVIFNVKQAYYNVLQSRRSRDVTADIVKQFQQHLDQAKGFYEVGTKAKIDVTKAEVDLSNARLNLIRAENAVKISWVVLNNAMGMPQAPEYTVEDNLAIHKFEISFDDALKRAYENRPDLKALIAKREAAQEAVGLARTGYYPVLNGSASYNRSGQDLDVSLDHGWSAGVVLTIPLFNGFLTSHQVAEAKANMYVLKANEETLRQQVLLDIQQSYLNLQQANDSIATAELAVQQAQENLDLANGRYAAGVGSPIEVTDAFAAYTNAQASYTNALYSYKIAQASIEQAMGAR
jgi:outer membrane protein TolC